jgi:2-polyprenyl-3-methyl-5-hydroxy-6-metoxy-1,4-benzoquinol methylase
MTAHPDSFSSYYHTGIQNIDRRLAYYGYLQFTPFFKGKTCLELGPATGYMTKFLLEDFQELTAVEGSLDLLEQIPTHERLRKVHSLFEQYNPEKKFDTIVMSHVLEHIESPVPLLKRIKEWMHKDSAFILAVPNAKSFHRLAAVKMGMLKTEYEMNDRDRALGHYRVYDMSTLVRDALAAGFSVKHEGGILLKFLSNNQIEKFIDNNVLDAYFQLSDQFKENSAEIFIVLGLP